MRDETTSSMNKETSTEITASKNSFVSSQLLFSIIYIIRRTLPRHVSQGRLACSAVPPQRTYLQYKS